MAAVRSRLQTTGLSPEVCKILLASWRTSTQKRYEGPWQQWASWCLERNKCPFSAPVADVLDFLSEQFNNRNLAYRTVGVYKECISQKHDPIDGLQLGSLPLVSRFMKGSQTISRWLCTLIRLAGVDVCYTGHSTRAASTSEAFDNGVPLEVVLEAADWSSAQTFEKHCHKRADKAQFAHKVLGAVNN
ncbi:Integrase recombinase xerD-like [Paramuricea clavata]|uniref:Integrase recombinase xerD-like n=1 Tax=Paramuricea clavata TaxID=317549 RepID=A0A7D9JDE2_PARCT|nr:Integrase recombinase xerD-like [Paramuricea clavata]